MKMLLREALYLAVALAASWWFFLRPPPEVVGVARQAPGPMLPVELIPLLVASGESEETAAAPAVAPDAGVELDEWLEEGPEEVPEEWLASPSSPPPPELGTPEGEEQDEPGARAIDPEPSDPPVEPPANATAAEQASPREPDVPVEQPAAESATATGAAGPPRDVPELMRDPTLLAAAGAELSGEERRGFATVLLAAPEEQLAIARFFGEELVLVPRAAIDPETADPRWFRVAEEIARVEEVRGRPPLERYRQYRDLLDYEYARLPDVLRDLRRRVVSRRDVYVFAALIPAREWAVVVARRNDALALAGRELAEVRSLTLRYLELGAGAFDLAVDHVVFADGSRYRPPSSIAEKGAGTR